LLEHLEEFGFVYFEFDLLGKGFDKAAAKFVKEILT